MTREALLALAERADRLRAFIREHAPGGCKWFSLGPNGCQCPLCDVDALMRPLRALATPPAALTNLVGRLRHLAWCRDAESPTGYDRDLLNEAADMLLTFATPPAGETSPILAFQQWVESFPLGRPLTQDEYFAAQAAFYAAHPGDGPKSTPMPAGETPQGEALKHYYSGENSHVFWRAINANGSDELYDRALALQVAEKDVLALLRATPDRSEG